MKITQINLSDRRLVNQFLEFPFELYAGTPQWVPPLRSDARKMMDSGRNPFFRHSQASFWLALDHRGLPAGRLAVLVNRNYNDYNHEKTAFFYLFECRDDLETALGLFESGFAWAVSQGMDKMVGPKGFTVFDGLGMLVSGFEYRPAFGLPYNLPYFPRLVEGAGFETQGELVSGYLDYTVQFPEKLHQVADLLMQRRGLHVTRFANRRDLRHIIPSLKDLYNSSLGETSGNTPMTDDEIKALTDQMLWFADPKLVKIVMKADQPVGFLLAYPDVSAAIQRTQGRLFPFGWLLLLRELRRTKWVNVNGAGMMEGYRGLGGTALLFSEMFKSLEEGGFRYADLVQIGVENDRMLRELRDLGVLFYKKHRLYQKSL